MFRPLSRLLAEIDLSPRGAVKPRRSALPRLEALEGRWVPSTIAGVVYNDANNVGVYQAGDPVYANNPISLLNASGATIASTTTDGNGHYAFTVDQTINTAPATQEQDLSFGPVSTDSPQTLQVAQFDPSLGALTSVEIDEAGTISSHLQVDNLDPAQATVQANIQGAVTLQGAGLTNALTANVQASESATLSASDGTFGFNGAAAHDFGTKDAEGSQAVTLSAATNDLSAFVGTGKTTLSAVGTAGVSESGPGNLLSLIQSTASGKVKVVYHYTPSNALKPGQYTVVQTANPPGTYEGTNTSNGVPVPPGTPGDHIPVTLPPGGDSLHNDFGEVLPAKVSGYVYLDNNQDGQIDSGDMPLANETVTISGSTADGVGVVSATAATDINGFYSFTMPPGDYTITQPGIPGLNRGATTVGSLGGTEPGPGVLTVDLAGGQAGYNYNFGYLTQSVPIPPPPPQIPPQVIPTPPPQLPPEVPQIPPQVIPPQLIPPQTPPQVTKFDFLASTAWDGDF